MSKTKSKNGKNNLANWVYGTKTPVVKFFHWLMQFTCYLGECGIQYELLSLNDKQIDINIVDKEISNLSRQEDSILHA